MACWRLHHHIAPAEERDAVQLPWNSAQRRLDLRAPEGLLSSAGGLLPLLHDLSLTPRQAQGNSRKYDCPSAMHAGASPYYKQDDHSSRPPSVARQSREACADIVDIDGAKLLGLVKGFLFRNIDFDLSFTSLA